MVEEGRAAPGLSLSSRLVIGLTGLLAVGGLVLSLAAFAYGRSAARQAFDRLLVGAANDIAASITIMDGAPVIDLPVSAFELLALARDDRIAYQVSGPGGSVLTGYDDLPRLPAGASDTALYDAAFGGEPARFIQVTRRFAERNFSGQVQVIVGQTLRARTELAFDITRDALLALAVGGLAMLGFAVFVVHRALRPLDRLAREIAARDPRDLTRINASVPREVDTIVQAMNGFIGRLDHQFQTMKRLISDTAHQIRTPVAALRAQADLAIQEDDAVQRARIVETFHGGTVRLSRLLDQILSRALVIHRGDAARRALIDLRDIALDLFEEGDHRHIAPESEIRLGLSDAPVEVMADALSLTEAAKNLLANAVAHGRAPIIIGADRADGMARLWVQDGGEGPPAHVRQEQGRRFASGGAQRSVGLGISIAQAVAEAYGGRLEMENLSEGGFRVTILLPAEEAA